MNHFLADLSLSYFRSHRKLSLSLGAKPVVLFGANGAGKTNILEAVSLLSPGRGLRGAKSDELSRQPDNLGWKIKATLERNVGPIEIELSAENGTARNTRIDGKPQPQTALARHLKILWLVPVMDRLWVEGAEGRRRFLDRMTLSFLPDHAQAALTYEKTMRDRNRLLKDGVYDPHWYRALEAQMAQSGATLAANRKLALEALVAAQVGAETAFPQAQLSITNSGTEPEPETAEEIADTLEHHRDRDQAAGRTLRGPHRVDLEAVFAAKGVPARQCSTGEQKALLISLILANARALRAQSDSAPIMLLDEVAAHLDANRRAALYDEICGLEAQAFLTGTGAELFTELGSRAQALHVQEMDGKSTVEECAL